MPIRMSASLACEQARALLGGDRRNYAATRDPPAWPVERRIRTSVQACLSPGNVLPHRGRSEMSSKREERKQRSEAERLHREHQQRAKKLRARLFVVAGVLAVVAVALLSVTRRQGDSCRVWSAEHGHWHDK